MRLARLMAPLLFVIVGLLAARGDHTTAADPAPAAAQASVEVWRRTLTPGDADHDWLYAWTVDGIPAGDVQLVTGDHRITLKPFRLRPAAWYEAGWQCGYRLPLNTPSGEYALMFGTVPAGKITVAGRQRKLTTRVAPDGDAASVIEAAAVTGDVLLSPGEYRLARPIRLPAGRVLRGYGAIITADRFFTGEPSASFQGITFQGGWLGTFSTGCHFASCTFDRCQVWAQGGLFTDCVFRGLSGDADGNTHAFSSWGTTAPLGLIGCLFDQCDRGPVLNTFGGGEILGALFADITVRGVGWIDNGNEVLCIEGGEESPGVVRCLFLRWRVYDCEGDATAFYVPVRSCVFDGWALDRASLLMLATKPATLTKNRIMRMEFRGGGISLGTGVSDTTIDRCAFLQTGVFRGNRGFTQPFFYDGKLNEAEAAKYNPPARVTANGASGQGLVTNSYFQP